MPVASKGPALQRRKFALDIVCVFESDVRLRGRTATFAQRKRIQLILWCIQKDTLGRTKQELQTPYKNIDLTSTHVTDLRVAPLFLMFIR